MATTLVEQQFLQAIQGTQISFTDWQQQYASLAAIFGQGIAAQQGITAGLPNVQPLLVTFPGGMGIWLGQVATPSSPQFAFTRAQLSATTALTGYTVPNNSTGSTRNDAIVCQPGQIQITTVNREVEATDGSKSIQAIPIVYFGLVFQYITGPSGGGSPSIPAGFDEFCTISVANGAVSINSSNVTVLFPVMNAQGAGATMTTSTVTAPSIGSSVVLPVLRTDAFPIGTPVFAVNAGATVGFTGTVTARSTSANAGNLTVQVSGYPIGVPGSFASGATVTFGGIAGAIGAAGHGTTSNTTAIGPSNSLPAIGGNTTFTVLDPTAFPTGTYGYVVGPFNALAMFFSVVSVSGNTLTVTALGYGLGAGPGLGPINPNGTVTFSGIPGTCINTNGMTTPAVGASVNIPLTHADPFPQDSYGLMAGPLGAKAFVFQVNSQTGNTINVTCIAITSGNQSGGDALAMGGICYPLGSVNVGVLNGSAQPLTITQDGVIAKSSFSNSQASPCQATVNLQIPYSNTNYTIQLTSTADGSMPYITEGNITTAGFRINFGTTSSPGGACDVFWKTTGH